MGLGKNGTPHTLTVAGDTVTISDLVAKKLNLFIAHAISVTGNTQHKFKYNNISTSVYAERYRVNNGTDNSLTSQSALVPDPTGTNDDKFSVNFTVSISGEEKLSIIFGVAQSSSGAGTAPSRTYNVGKFVPSPDADITRIDLFNGSAGDFDVDSNLSALGAD